MDTCDQAEVEITNYANSCLEKSKTKYSNVKLHPIGRCHYCDELVSPIQLFCNKTCAGLYEKELSNKR